MVGKSVGNELKVGPLCLHGHLQGELFQACPPGRRPGHTGGLVPLEWPGVPQEELEEVAERQVWVSLLRLLPPQLAPGC